ncbi:MAG TPA: hypothetical protein VFS00_29440, partial [Polyangiaceae bacterium]|nr:hypothetical protein [Polyangiaceae bacterium]
MSDLALLLLVAAIVFASVAWGVYGVQRRRELERYAREQRAIRGPIPPALPRAGDPGRQPGNLALPPPAPSLEASAAPAKGEALEAHARTSEGRLASDAAEGADRLAAGASNDRGAPAPRASDRDVASAIETAARSATGASEVETAARSAASASESEAARSAISASEIEAAARAATRASESEAARSATSASAIETAARAATHASEIETAARSASASASEVKAAAGAASAAASAAGATPEASVVSIEPGSPGDTAVVAGKPETDADRAPAVVLVHGILGFDHLK